MLNVDRFVCGPLQNNVYVLVNDETRQCAVVDPGIGTIAVLEHIRDQELAVTHILLTHGHFDHLYDLAQYKKAFGAQVVLHPADLDLLRRLPQVAESWGVGGAAPAPEPDILVHHGQILDVAGGQVEVRHTPGHSPGQVAYVVPGHVLVGDTLFWRGIGRYDLPGSDYDQLVASIREQLFTLPPETVVWPGHGEPTTIGDEIRHNPYIGDNVRFKPKE